MVNSSCKCPAADGNSDIFKFSPAATGPLQDMQVYMFDGYSMTPLTSVTALDGAISSSRWTQKRILQRPCLPV
jgi:hypothetical protein